MSQRSVLQVATLHQSDMSGYMFDKRLSSFLQGTVVTAGRAKAVVISTGSSTAIGRIRYSIFPTMNSIES